VLQRTENKFVVREKYTLFLGCQMLIRPSVDSLLFFNCDMFVHRYSCFTSSEY
jgi:hypothetical protein